MGPYGPGHAEYVVEFNFFICRVRSSFLHDKPYENVKSA